jgi:hypothetical protein
MLVQWDLDQLSVVYGYSSVIICGGPYFFKVNVYENNPQTIGELKAAITAKIREIP